MLNSILIEVLKEPVAEFVAAPVLEHFIHAFVILGIFQFFNQDRGLLLRVGDHLLVEPEIHEHDDKSHAVNGEAAAHQRDPGGAHGGDFTVSPEVRQRVHTRQQDGDRQDETDVSRHFVGEIFDAEHKGRLMFEKISEIVEHIADQEQENESKKKNRKGIMNSLRI